MEIIKEGSTMIITETRPIPTFADDYARFVERREQIEEEVKAEFEQKLAERTKKLDDLIALVSETVEVEVPDEELEEEVVEETNENYTGV